LRGCSIDVLERYVIRGGREGYDRLRILARARCVANAELDVRKAPLQHLSRPVDLLRRMWAAVAPGGAIVVEDADFDGLFCHPPNDGFAFYARVYPRVLEPHGGDAAIGRKLYGCFLAATIPDPNLRLVQRADAIGEAKTLSLLSDDTVEAIARHAR
jgi:hypothetical protein